MKPDGVSLLPRMAPVGRKAFKVSTLIQLMLSPLFPVMIFMFLSVRFVPFMFLPAAMIEILRRCGAPPSRVIALQFLRRLPRRQTVR
jgi:hypothetical protein